MLKQMQKPINLNIALEILEKIQSAGIETRASFLLGYPGESVESIEQTIKFALKAKLDYATFNIATPYPGTELYKWAKRNKRLLDDNLENYTGQKPIIKLDGFTPEEIVSQLRKCYRSFYFRPGYIWRRFRRIRNLNDVVQLFNGAIAIAKQ